MDFAPDAVHGRARRARAARSSTSTCYPAEPVLEAAAGRDARRVGHAADRAATCRRQASEQGLWNLFLPGRGAATNLQYAPVAELTGRSPRLAPAAFNCAAPDTGNMELLTEFGTPEQKERVARAAAGRRDPVGVLHDRARRGLVRRVPASPPASVRDGDEYVITGRKWWSTGAMNPDCALFIVMGDDRSRRPSATVSRA